MNILLEISPDRYADYFRQAFQPDYLCRFQRYCALNSVFQLTHIARPTVGLQTMQRRVERILGSIKSYSARRINKLHRRTGKSFWLSECFDRIARSDKDVDGIAEYIHGNPVRWRLAAQPEDYRWSSASTIYSGREEYRNWFL